jgi:hypothetical protein
LQDEPAVPRRADGEVVDRVAVEVADREGGAEQLVLARRLTRQVVLGVEIRVRR